MEKSNLRGAPHPPFSPDLALSDFFAFAKSEESCKELNSRQGRPPYGHPGDFGWDTRPSIESGVYRMGKVVGNLH
jgi:hypothetical protein